MGSNPIMSIMLDSNFNSKKSLYYNLKTIKGISSYKAQTICNTLGVSTVFILKDLSSRKLSQLSNILADLERDPTIYRNLDLNLKDRIDTLIKINTHRGRRIKYGYPARGQRTSTNAKTSRKTRNQFYL